MSDIAWRDQYRHPLWQKRRLERLEVARWACENCGSTTEQLHVHHPQYFKGRLIWQYEDGELQVLCSDCHESAHATLDKIKSAISQVSPEHLEIVLGLIQSFNAGSSPIKIESYEHATGLGLMYHLSADEVIDLDAGSQGITDAALMNAWREKNRVNHGSN